MAVSIQALREQRAAKAKEARNLIENTSDWNQDAQSSFDKLSDEITSLEKQIENFENVLSMEARDREVVNHIMEADDQSGRRRTKQQVEDSIEMGRQVFDSWARNGLNGLTDEQRQWLRAERQRKQEVYGSLSKGTPAEGGHLAPDEFAATLLEEQKAYGGTRGVADVMRTANGNTIEWPTTDATAEEGELVGENTLVTEGDTSFGITNIGAYKYSSKYIAVPFELLQDSQIDIEAYIRRLLAERIARITNRHFTVGTGTNQPQGIVTAASEGVVGTTGQTTGISYDDLVDLEHSIDPAYRAQGCGFMFHDSTLKVLKKLKDADGRPLWMPGLTSGEPNTIMNYGYTINQNMPVMTASAKSVLFGNFKKYKIRDVMAVMLFRMTDSAFTMKGQVGFLAFSRHDGRLIDSSNSAIKYYQNSAT